MKSFLRLRTVLALSLINFCLCSFASARGQASDPPSTEKSAPASAQVQTAESASDAGVIIPGPLRSFLRMAGISQKISPEEVVPLLARNVFSIGYSRGRPTEFLVLLNGYVHQARELSALAGSSGVIHISSCNEVAPLLHIIGYRLRQTCGTSGASLVTAEANRAFLTIDSGFPLPEFEQALQKGGPFTYAFPSTHVPVLFTESDWIAAGKQQSHSSQDFIDTLLHDPAISRLYWAMSRTDPETRTVLRQSPGLQKLIASGGILDFYGNYISIRSGRVAVPGGSQAEPAWKDLVGASPDSPGQFVSQLLSKDKGWLAAYFDVLSRADQTEQAHLTEPSRLKHLYAAFRSPSLSLDAARQTFRPAPALLLLVTRLQWDSNGQPRIPGSLDVWKQILRESDSKAAREWGKHSTHWNRPEQLLEALFSLSRQETEFGPVQIYLQLSELDNARPRDRQLSPRTAASLAATFSKFSDQYLVFTEFPELNDESIDRFLKVAESVDGTSSHTLRGNTMGSFQANIGLWQIFARQGQIRPANLNESWQKVIQPFSRVSSPAELFDATRQSLTSLMVEVTGKRQFSQDEVVELLAGPQQRTPEGSRIHRELAERIQAVLNAQRLVSLDTLLELGAGLKEMAHGAAIGDQMVPLAEELREFQMPRPIFSNSERTQWASGIYNDHHTELQMKTDLVKAIKSSGSHAELEEMRGQLSPFLRDTLVGLNYAYYEPPGAQVLLNNPLFVRSHDFAGETVMGVEGLWQSPQLFGVGSPAGGGAHLVGSLADLPYVLAEVEQDFIAPENVQALIWRELAPGLLASATLPRWWNVSRNELHAVALYQRNGEELIRASASNQDLRAKVLKILSYRMAPQRLDMVERGLLSGRVDEAFVQILPADTFYLTALFRQRFPDDAGGMGSAGKELEELSRRYPGEVSWERLSHDFGVPHPALAQSNATELLNLQLFPAFEGYSSRLLAESWDSSNLYWARLADEMGYPPVVLNHLVPELTRRMVAKIFGTDLEDWPAVLRALRETGEDFRQGKIAVLASVAPLPQN